MFEFQSRPFGQLPMMDRDFGIVCVRYCLCAAVTLLGLKFGGAVDPAKEYAVAASHDGKINDYLFRSMILPFAFGNAASMGRC